MHNFHGQPTFLPAHCLITKFCRWRWRLFVTSSTQTQQGELRSSSIAFIGNSLHVNCRTCPNPALETINIYIKKQKCKRQFTDPPRIKKAFTDGSHLRRAVRVCLLIVMSKNSVISIINCVGHKAKVNQNYVRGKNLDDNDTRKTQNSTERRNLPVTSLYLCFTLTGIILLTRVETSQHYKSLLTEEVEHHLVAGPGHAEERICPQEGGRLLEVQWSCSFCCEAENNVSAATRGALVKRCFLFDVIKINSITIPNKMCKNI